MRTRFDGKEIAVTATFGIAVDVPSHKRENEQPRHLVEHAERAMDRQKELGVNRHRELNQSETLLGVWLGDHDQGAAETPYFSKAPTSWMTDLGVRAPRSRSE